MSERPDLQPASQRPAPIGDIGAVTAGSASRRNDNGPRCSCGASAHATVDGHCARGHMMRGNHAALVIGHRSVAFWTTAAPTVDGIVARLLREFGCDDTNAPDDLLALFEGFAHATVGRKGTWLRIIESGGSLTTDGRTRPATNVWKMYNDSVRAYADDIERRRQEAKPAQSLSDYLNGTGSEHLSRSAEQADADHGVHGVVAEPEARSPLPSACPSSVCSAVSMTTEQTEGVQRASSPVDVGQVTSPLDPACSSVSSVDEGDR